jgi:triphosphoribosyl-dephospho-CoA synthase
MTPAAAVAFTARPRSAPGLAAQAIGRAATLALHDELVLSPKPGLVTPTDTGSHTDMDAHTFMRSLFALRSYFVRIASLGADGAPFQALERCGIEAEMRMLSATGGVNTHRGSIFMLGLLCAAAGAVAGQSRHPTPALLRSTLLARWGEALAARATRTPTLPGGLAAHRYGLRSASEEAALGFPVLFETAVPAMQAAGARGMARQDALLDTLFSIMAVLDDSNIAHRGGMEGLRHAQHAARTFLDAGGASRPGGVTAARDIGEDFVRRRLSPGGAADTLAAACWMQRLGLPGATLSAP